ncbi:MAG: hypothetical protein ACK5AZ_12170 [Bryobacteraceae bacterium]
MELFTLALLPALAIAAEPRWIEMHSENFSVLSSAGERARRDTLKHFEQVRAFFIETMKDSLAATQPVRIVIFGSKKEYEQYRPGESVVAYYRPGFDRDYIVMSHAGVEAFPVAVHEYFHLIVQHAKMTLPPWLEEGLAELYSTLRPIGGKITVGTTIPTRHQALLQDPWVPLAQIVAADRNSAFYNDKNKMSSLYNQGWLWPT